MFRRKSAESTDPVDSPPELTHSGKGRPTRSRKEAEAEAKARAKVPRTRKEIAAERRLARAESSTKMRQAMRTGDERYLPARDRGPVRRFVRDYIDSRFSLIELLIPVMVLVLALGYSGRPNLVALANTAMLVTFLVIAVDMVRLRFRIKREIGRRFPGESMKGITYYALSRAMQPKFLRMPKSQVRIGQKLPERYR